MLILIRGPRGVIPGATLAIWSRIFVVIVVRIGLAWRVDDV